MSDDEREELLRLRAENAAYAGLLNQEQKRATVAEAQVGILTRQHHDALARIASSRAECERVTTRLQALLMSFTLDGDGGGCLDATLVADVWPEWRAAHARVHAAARNPAREAHIG